MEITLKAGVGALRTILYRTYQEVGVCQSSWKYGETTGVDILQRGAEHVCGLRDSTSGRDWVGYRPSGQGTLVCTWRLGKDTDLPPVLALHCLTLWYLSDL